jgi:hypothetical protein
MKQTASSFIPELAVNEFAMTGIANSPKIMIFAKQSNIFGANWNDLYRI